MRRPLLKNYILNLFGIEAVLPKGTAYILLDNTSVISGTAPSLCQGLIMVNVDYRIDQDLKFFEITKKRTGESK